MEFVQETDLRFYIKESTIPNAGLGCFAGERIVKGDFLEIIGVQVEHGSLIDKCTHYANHYKVPAESGVIIPFGFAAMVNYASKPEDQNVAIAHLPNHEVRNEHACQTVYMVLRDIEKGEELLASYNKKQVQDFPLQDWNKFAKMDLYDLGVLV